MAETQSIRRSGRRHIRPLEHWNFEKPEDVTEKVTYNEAELTRNNVFESLFSLKKANRGDTHVQGRGKRQGEEGGGGDTHLTLPVKTKINVAVKRKVAMENGSLMNGDVTARSPLRKRVVEKEEEDGQPTKDSRNLRESTGLTSKKQKVTERKETRREKSRSLSREDRLPSPRIGGYRSNKRIRDIMEENRLTQNKRVERTAVEESERRHIVGKNLSVMPSFAADTTASLTAATTAMTTTNFNNNTNFNTNDFYNTYTGKTSYLNSLSLAEKNTTTHTNTTTNTTNYDQPSFRNVLTSTVLEATNRSVFKLPKLPTWRSKPRIDSTCPSMMTIPEEEQEARQTDGDEGGQGAANGNVEEDKDEERTNQQNVDEERRKTTLNEQKLDEMKRKRNVERQMERTEDGVSSVQISAPSSSECVETAMTSDTDITLVRGGHQNQKVAGTQDRNVRRSSRVRTKPLEHWNFEKVEVQRDESGAVRVIHHKQDSTFSIHSRVVDCSSLTVKPGCGFTLTDDQLGKKSGNTSRPKESSKKGTTYPALSPTIRKVDARKLMSSWKASDRKFKSPSKRQLFSPGNNFYKEPVEEGERPKETRVGDLLVEVTGVHKFEDIKFMMMEKEEYKCYVGNVVQNPTAGFFVSFLFLERGEIVWRCTRKLTLYVMEGIGVLKVIRNKENTAHHLKQKCVVECGKDSKLCLKKDGRSKILKLHLCLVDDKVQVEDGGGN